MFRCGFVLLLVATCCSGFPTVEEFPRQKRIVGGTTYPAHKYPFHVSLWFKKDKKYSHRCGGTLIANQWVLTAAHCFDSTIHKDSDLTKTWRVYTPIHTLSGAASSGKYVKIVKIFKHNDFSSQTKYADIALIKLTQSVSNPTLAVLNSDSKCPQKKSVVNVIGWGQVSKGEPFSDTPKIATLMVKDKKKYEKIYNKEFKASNMRFDHTVICAGHSDWKESSARGDSGSPLLATCTGSLKVVGVVSHGHPELFKPKFPAVFTSVSAFYDWIQTTMTNN